MTDKTIHIHAFLEQINDCCINIGIDVDDYEYDDITMTEDDRNEIKKRIEINAKTLGLAVKNLQKHLEKYCGVR